MILANSCLLLKLFRNKQTNITNNNWALLSYKVFGLTVTNTLLHLVLSVGDTCVNVRHRWIRFLGGLGQDLGVTDQPPMSLMDLQ